MESKALFDGRYQLKKLIGNGGFAQVWLAYDTIAGIELALKVYIPNGPLDEQGKEDFKKEFANLCALNHTNIIRAIGFGIYKDELPYLGMTVCKGGSGKTLIGKANEEQLWEFFRQVASGLQYLHNNHHMVHQDIKPDNVLINDEGQYLIIDFGISKKTRNTLRRSTKGNVGSGTTWYMSVESFGPDNSVFARDIWALGATMYELMTGDVPFGQYGGLTQKEQDGKIPPITQEFSGGLKQLVYDCLALNAWDRPSAGEVLQRIQDRGSGPEPWIDWRKIISSAMVMIVAVVSLSLGWRYYGKLRLENAYESMQKKNDSIYLAIINQTYQVVERESSIITNQKEAAKISVRKLADAIEEVPKYKALEDSISEGAREKGEETKSMMSRSLNEVNDFLEAAAQSKLDAYGEFGRDAYNYYMTISDSIKSFRQIIN